MSLTSKPIDVELLKKDFFLDSKYMLRHARNKGPRGKKGALAGAVRADGRREVGWQGQLWLAYRLIWVLSNGKDIPSGFQIDHADLDPTNDSPMNLRLATASQNLMNRRAQKNNKLGIKGVELLPSGSFRARCKTGRNREVTGCFPTIDQAREAYSVWAHECHGEFACHS